MNAKRRSAGAEGHYLKWMLALMVIAILLALLVPGVSANWWRSEVTINNGGSALTDYQVLVELTDYTRIDSKGDSIRFTNIANSTKYDYWIEKWDTSGTSKIWVEVPSIAAGTSYMYLWTTEDTGPSAESDGDATFRFFDGFSGSIDTKWNTEGSGWSVSGGELKGVHSSGRLTSKSTFSDGVILEIKSKYDLEAHQGYMIGGFFSSTIDAFGFLNNPSTDWYRDDPTYFELNGEDDRKVPTDTNLLTKISVTSASSVDLSVTNYDPPYDIYHSISATNPVSGEPIALGKRYDNMYAENTYEAYWDWIRVRKYASTEPTILVGGAEDAGGGQPVPELSTVILFSVGLIVLAGYVSLRRREKKKGK